MRRALVISTLGLLLSGACTIRSPQPYLGDQDVRLTVLHTADAHSRLMKYRFTPTATYLGLGLDPATLPAEVDEYTVGGADRLAYLLRRERSLASRVIHVDSGDGYQGAPIFNLWQGEAESRVWTELGCDAQVIGNHEFDASAQNYAEKLETWAGYPVLAANYIFEDDTKPWNNTLNRVAQPWTVVEAMGLRVGIVGMGNLDSLNSITEQGNSLGVIPLETLYAAEAAVEQVRHIADVVVLVTHMGPDEDRYIAENVKHIDIIMGGHLHIALDPPQAAKDPDGRDVLIVHSNAFLRFLGRLDVVLRKSADPEHAAEYGFEVVSHKWKLFPIDNRVDFEIARAGKPPHEVKAAKMAARMRNILEEYQVAMAQQLDLGRTVGCSTDDRIVRFGQNEGDSPLGNIVAEAMQTHPRVETDFAMTNAGGIRDDLRGRIVPPDDPRACIDEEGNAVYAMELEELYNVIPFDNTITTMFLTGSEVQAMFDYAAYRSGSRGCRSQVHISGATVTLVCYGDEHGDYAHADDVRIGGLPINPNGSYELAANSYIANGGSGFEVLERNTTQVDTHISQRDAVVEYLKRLNIVPCRDNHPTMPDCPRELVAGGLEDGRIRMER